MYLSCIRITFRNSGNISSNSENFHDSLWCVCNFPPIEECQGHRVLVKVKVTVGEDCVKLFTRPLNHKLLTFSSVLYFSVCVLLKWHHWSKNLYLHNSVNSAFNFYLHHISHEPTYSLITAMLFHHFIKSSQWEQWNRSVSVRGKHYSSSCWHTLYLDHLPQTPKSINCWKWGRGSREISAATKREYM